MKCKKPIIYISIPALIFFGYFLFVQTPLFIPRQKEIALPVEIQSEVMKQIAAQLPFKDMLYLATTRTVGVCGNDERYDGIRTISEQIERIKYVRKNPYFIDGSKMEEHVYTFGSKVIITGSASATAFTSGNIHFDNDNHPNKVSYDLAFPTVEKDRLVIAVTDYENGNTGKGKVTLVSKKLKWVLE